MTEHLLYRSWLNTHCTGVDWTLIIQELIEHLLYRSRLNTYYTEADWTLIVQESTEQYYFSGVDWTLIVQESTEHLLYRSWLNTIIIQEESRLNTYLYAGVDRTLILKRTRVDWTLITHKLALELNSYLYPAKSRLNTCIIQGPKFLHVAIRIVILLDTTVSMNCRGIKIVSSVSIFCIYMINFGIVLQA